LKDALLNYLVSLLKEKTECACVTDIRSGNQCVLSGDTVEGDLKLTEAEFGEVSNYLTQFRSGVFNSKNIFVRTYSSPLKLIVVGAVHITQTLVPLAQTVGFDVIVIEPRKGFCASNSFQNIEVYNQWPDEALEVLMLDNRTALVTLTHDPKLDDPALIAALNSNAFYIGALGSKRTHFKRKQRLSDQCINDMALKRIYGPIGLDINAISPAEIAVSIISQIISVHRAV
jgi:xanthine dehydrogenase accessory factor